MDELGKRMGEASSWAGLAAALWGGTALLPAQLAGAWGLDELTWRSVGVAVALLATIVAIARPERAARPAIVQPEARP